MATVVNKSWPCGHKRTPANTQKVGKGERCALCLQVENEHALPKLIREPKGRPMPECLLHFFWTGVPFEGSPVSVPPRWLAGDDQ